MSVTNNLIVQVRNHLNEATKIPYLRDEVNTEELLSAVIALTEAVSWLTLRVKNLEKKVSAQSKE